MLLEKHLIVVGERRDLISKVVFSLRDLLLQKTGLELQGFLVACLPCTMLHSLDSGLPGIYGVGKSLLETEIDRLSAYQKNSPIIVDVESGQVMSVHLWRSILKLKGEPLHQAHLVEA